LRKYCSMVKVKFTDRKIAKKGQDELRVAHPCRFPGCDRVFSHRQGMSRHMKLAHSAVAGTFAPVTVARTVARTTAPSTVVAKVNRLMDAFRGCGDPDPAEMLLSEATLDEVLRTVPVPPAVIVYSDISDVEPDDADEVAVYAVVDEPDDDAPDVAPLKIRRVRRPSCRTPPALPAIEGAPVYATSPQSTVARKNLVPDFMLRAAAANWPDKLTVVSHSDLARALGSLPDSSSRDIAAAVADHFELTPQQSLAVRRRAAAMVAMEQHVVTRVRRLLPVASSTPDAAVEAIRRINELLRDLGARPVLPFE